ncbi:MAG: DUF2809 domain-containing protein [Bacteroidales bacterium]|nr:DUF2809 domain-containing protein [Bacteroidales bacterium]
MLKSLNKANKINSSNIYKKRLRTLFSIIIITPIGFYSKFYNGPAHNWVNDSFGGTLYEIFWCLVFYFLFPKSKTWLIALLVLIITCILEFLQLWHPLFLEYLRNNFIGRTILGVSFNWFDIPYYLLGSGIGWFWLKKIEKSTTS